MSVIDKIKHKNCDNIILQYLIFLILQYYSSISFLKKVLTHQVMSTTTFIANIGGMLGLCMGFSFVTLVEIFYFLSNVFLNIAGLAK